MKYINWKNHLIELVVVFIGITAAFTLNNWQENRKTAQLQNKYIESLFQDLENDCSELSNLIHFYDNALHAIKRLEILAAQTKTRNDSMNYYAQNLLVLNAFIPQKATYESLKTSGDLKIIDDFDLKRKISSLFIHTIMLSLCSTYVLLSTQYVITLWRHTNAKVFFFTFYPHNNNYY